RTNLWGHEGRTLGIAIPTGDAGGHEHVRGQRHLQEPLELDELVIRDRRLHVEAADLREDRVLRFAVARLGPGVSDEGQVKGDAVPPRGGGAADDILDALLLPEGAGEEG